MAEVAPPDRPTTPLSATPSTPLSESPPTPPRTDGQASPIQTPSPPSECDPHANPHAPSPHSNASMSSFSSTTCIVCMDQPKDIAFSPCKHSHCCLVCFRRSRTRACPVCRTTVTAVTVHSTGIELPVSLVAPRDRAPRPLSPPAEPRLYERATHLHTRSLTVASSPRRPEGAATAPARASLVSTVSVARQAQFSVRSSVRSQDAAVRPLRQGGSSRPESPVSMAPTLMDSQRRHTISSTTSSTASTTPMGRTDQSLSANDTDNIVLIGHSREIMVALAQKLIATFPPPPSDRTGNVRSKSMLYVNGKGIRLVLIECPLSSTNADLVARVQRQSPKLILLCADYYNVSSFEFIVRLDMEVLDFLNVSCIWVLVKSALVSRPKNSIIVDDEDVRTANHFLSSPRKYIVATVDTTLQSGNVRKLGQFMYRCAGGSLSPMLSTSDTSSSAMPARSQRFFCFKADKKVKKKWGNASTITSTVVRWLLY